MRYELIIDTVLPGRTYEYLDRFASINRSSEEGVALEGCWTTDDDTAYSGFGTLNQVFHLWSSPTAGGAVAVSGDPGGIVVSRQVDVLTPAPFMKNIEPQATWSMYELAIDTVRPGTLQQVMAAWERGLADRVRHGPLAGCWTSEADNVHRVFHLWGCPGLRNRERIRNQSWKPGVWPPAREALLAQENRLLIPALFAADENNRDNLAAALASTAPTYAPKAVAGKAPG